MHGHAFGDRTVADHQLEAGRSRVLDLRASGRAEHEDAGRPERHPERERLRHRGDAEGRRAGSERGAPNIDGAVPVAVRLDDCPELGAGEGARQPGRVAPDRAEVDRHDRPHQTGIIMVSKANAMLRPTSAASRVRSSCPSPHTSST